MDKPTPPPMLPPRSVQPPQSSQAVVVRAHSTGMPNVATPQRDIFRRAIRICRREQLEPAPAARGIQI